MEGWAKRHYDNVFRRHIQDTIGSADETKLWLEFAMECGYLSIEQHKCLLDKYTEIGMMLHGLYERWRTLRKASDPNTRDEG